MRKFMHQLQLCVFANIIRLLRLILVADFFYKYPEVYPNIGLCTVQSTGSYAYLS